MEEWKICPEYPNYEVSNLGEVRNTKTKKVLSKHQDKDGYFRVGLFYNKRKCTKSVHRLVAVTFIPNSDDTLVVDHINQNRQDNRVENLRWTTRSGNSRNTQYNSKVKVCDETGKIVNEFNTIIEAAEYYNIPNDKMCAATVVNSKLNGFITYA